MTTAADTSTARGAGTIGTGIQGRVGTITLNRVGALNALTTPMVEAIASVLADWETTDLHAVVLASTSPKAFCAGGDIRAIQENTLAGHDASSERFFLAEYHLNARIAEYPIPIVSLIDGICMGGGLGLSVHGHFRVVSEKALMAMPETRIGFFPDIGASYFLPRLPGALGTYIGLTGVQLTPSDALYCGLATHFVPSDRLTQITPALERHTERPVEQTLRSLAAAPSVGESELAQHRADIDWCFNAPTLPEIEARLANAVDQEWGAQTRSTLASLSPQSVQITLDLLIRGAQQSLRECLATELQLARGVIQSPDFVEGIRAALVDKDRNPSWGSSHYLGLTHDGSPRWLI